MIANKIWSKKLKPIIDNNKSLANLKKNKNIVPESRFWFNAFEKCPYNKLKVVIIGADPYPNEKDAHGLAFSVIRKNNLPRTLQNIYKALYIDLKIENKNGNLSPWAKQGVLLLNSSLTVDNYSKKGHHKIWFPVIKDIIEVINNKKTPIAWGLWGSVAKEFKPFIKTDNNIIFEHVHPSPRVRYNDFIFSKPFSKINNFLKEQNLKEIEWKIK